MAFQIKLYIRPDDEIRRFVLEGNATFATLQQRVKELVGRDDLRLFWQDEEGDHIVCGSEDEFQVARQAIDKNGLLRLYAKPGKTNGEPDEKHVHRRITCDGCEGIIAGTRYKCLECPDFDLCEACEQRAAHSEHDMIAVRRPRTHEWKKLFAQGYGARTGLRCHGPFSGPGEPGPCGPGPCGPGSCAPGPFGPGPAGAGPCGPGPCGPGPRGPCGFGRRGPFGHGRFMPPFVRQMMQNLGQTVEMDIDMNRPLPEVIADITKKVQEAIGRAQGSQQQQQQPQESEKKEDGKEAEPAPQPGTENDAVIATATAVAEAVNAVAEMIGETFSMPDNDSRVPSEADGWTHLQAEAPEETTVKQEGETTAEPEEPQLPQQEQPPNRIEAALRAMEEMGFPNEGNLLRRLLENYNGDIARVLDSIK